jgi:signal transduction histidine kinase
LSIVKSVVEAHGGSVRLADSRCGASFIIELPAMEPPAEETTAEETPAEEGS